VLTYVVLNALIIFELFLLVLVLSTASSRQVVFGLKTASAVAWLATAVSFVGWAGTLLVLWVLLL
jgi:hypothetical protein